MKNMCNKTTPLEDAVLRNTKTMHTKRREKEWVVLISTAVHTALPWHSGVICFRMLQKLRLGVAKLQKTAPPAAPVRFVQAYS